jgi:hypothetical protein
MTLSNNFEIAFENRILILSQNQVIPLGGSQPHNVEL